MVVQSVFYSIWVRISYPTIPQENGTQGRVTVQFVVNKDGSIVDVNVIRGVDPYLDKEAVRVISTMPKWKPENNVAYPYAASLQCLWRLSYNRISFKIITLFD